VCSGFGKFGMGWRGVLGHRTCTGAGGRYLGASGTAGVGDGTSGVNTRTHEQPTIQSLQSLMCVPVLQVNYPDRLIGCKRVRCVGHEDFIIRIPRETATTVTITNPQCM